MVGVFFGYKLLSVFDHAGERCSVGSLDSGHQATHVGFLSDEIFVDESLTSKIPVKCVRIYCLLM